MASPLIELIHIENSLQQLWNAFQIGSKARACLYNIIVYHKASKDPQHTQEILNAVSSKFPSRIFLISDADAPETPYLKVRTSLKSHSKEVICEQIDLDVSGHLIERVPFIILPNLNPDLPIYLFWMDDQFNSILDPLVKISNQVFLNSYASTDLSDFSDKILSLLNRHSTEITDLNWVNLRPWRKCFANVFHFPPRMKELECCREISIYYSEGNASHIQACYLLTWISHILGWSKTHVHASLIATSEVQKTVTKVSIRTESNTRFEMTLLENENQILVEISSPKQCETPYKLPVLSVNELETLKEEILEKRPNTHYYGVLKILQTRNCDGSVVH